MRIGYCTWTDPRNKRSWSGLHYYMMRALEKRCDALIPFGPLCRGHVFAGKVINRFTKAILKKRFDYTVIPLVSKAFAREIESKIRSERCDAIFCPAGREVLAYYNSPVPAVYFADSTFRQLVGYYPEFSNMFKSGERWGEECERRAIDVAASCVYSQKWAADSAIHDYGCAPEKVSIAEFGANLENIPGRDEVLSRRDRPGKPLKALFVGFDWVRKGGEIAYGAVVELNKRGVQAELIVCGPGPDRDAAKRDNLTVVGLLDKNRPDDAARLHRCYMEADIFIMPTRGECSAVVYCEAAAYGLPVLTTDTGGVSSYIVRGETGYALPLSGKPADYAAQAIDIISDNARYASFCRRSRQLYEDRLNWDVWGDRVIKVIDENIR